MKPATASATATRRLFIAIFPPRAIQAALRATGAALQTSPGGRAVTWVREANLHMTLRFLGDCDSERHAAASRAMAVAAAEHAPFAATLGALGAFPDAQRASTLWAGLAAGAEPMRSLVASLSRALSRRGFARADAAFVPHFSLGRLRVPADWAQSLTRMPTPDAGFDVAQVWLVESTLTPAGSRYRGLETAALGA